MSSFSSLLPHKPHKLLKEYLQLLNNAALLHGTPTTEATHGWEDRVDGGAGGLEPSVAERARDEPLRLVGGDFAGTAEYLGLGVFILVLILFERFVSGTFAKK